MVRCLLSAAQHVKVLVRWAKGKRLTNRLPNLSLITLSSPGTDRILRVDAPPHAVPISGDPEIFFRLGNTFFFKKRIHGGRETRTHDQNDPCSAVVAIFDKVLLIVRWAKGKSLTNRLRISNLSFITNTPARGVLRTCEGLSPLG